MNIFTPATKAIMFIKFGMGSRVLSPFKRFFWNLCMLDLYAPPIERKVLGFWEI